MSDAVTVELVDHVLRIGVNRPEKLNAHNLDVIGGLGAAYDRLADDDEARVGVLYAHGEHFSAGLDLAEVAPVVADEGPAALAGGATHDPYGMWGDQVEKPVVMAVQGYCFTVTIELALAADLVVAASDARFRQLEIGRGIIPFGGATVRAASQLGWGNAMRFLLTAEEFGAEEAHRIGLVQEVVEPGAQVERAFELAATVARQAPLGVVGTLVNARIAREEGEEAAKEHLAGLLPAIMASEDAAEGVRSFVERREAEFTGR